MPQSSYSAAALVVYSLTPLPPAHGASRLPSAEGFAPQPNRTFSIGRKAAQGRKDYQIKQKRRKIKGESSNKRREGPQKAQRAISLRTSGGPQLAPSLPPAKWQPQLFFCPVPKPPYRLPLPKATACYFCAWTELWAVFTVSTLLEQLLSIRFISYR